MEYIGYFISILIGVILGLIGAGGSILTLPMLVYIFHINPFEATYIESVLNEKISGIGKLKSILK